MNKTKLPDPAFPATIRMNTSSDPLATPREIVCTGLSRRGWFAGQALAALEGRISRDWDLDEQSARRIAFAAFLIADAMIEQDKR
jgi:hypothetical protein